MDFSNYFEQFLRQASEVQRGLFNSWTSTLPNMQSLNRPNSREAFDNNVKFQEEVITSSLELQAMLTRLSIETQKQFWDGYFKMIRRP
jgi:hypothetical protein